MLRVPVPSCFLLVNKVAGREIGGETFRIPRQVTNGGGRRELPCKGEEEYTSGLRVAEERT